MSVYKSGLFFTTFVLMNSLFFAQWIGANNSIQLKQDNESLSLVQNDTPLLVYRFHDALFKPYVQKLYTPNGFNVARDHVDDHPHHHGLMFALSVNGVSFWAEDESAGKQIHQTMGNIQTTQNDDGLNARFSEQLVWQGPNQKTLLHETRTIHLKQPANEAVNLLMWRSHLRCPSEQGSVTISGSHYYGLGIRFIEEMDETGTFINSEGADGTIFRGEERLVEADWCGYQVEQPQPVTVVFFDSPKNPKPATWFTMASPFAYLSATRRYHENEYKVIPGQPLDLRYTIGLFDGLPECEDLNRFYREWVLE